MKERKTRVFVFSDTKEVGLAYCDQFVRHGWEAINYLETHVLKNLDQPAESVDLLFFDLDIYTDEVTHLIKEVRKKYKVRPLRAVILVNPEASRKLRKLADENHWYLLPRSMSTEILFQFLFSLNSVSDPCIDYTEKHYAALRESMNEVLGFYLTESIEVTKKGKGFRAYKDNEVIALIPLYGAEFFGTVYMSMEESLVSHLAKSMMDENSLSLTEDEILDYLSEICNQFGGVLMEKLKDIGYNLTIGLPYKYRGNGSTSVHLGLNDTCYLDL